ncbi:STAS domain-containing protein [Psychrobacillus sp. FJAT-51614]|uniref:STAS domain-containing protein n=1 Tax=Psychrobacillus mangrovi TaxID=3117745 RepID=A0ABU8F6A7_9BACI
MSQEVEIQQLKDKIAYYEQIIQTMSTPIIPSIVPKTIMIPIVGYMFPERFENIETQTLMYIGENRDIENVVFDFTGVRLEDVVSFDYNDLAISISRLNGSLRLMGVRSIYVGFNPKFIREIVHASIHVEIETYKSFRAALNRLLSETNQTIASIYEVK